MLLAMEKFKEAKEAATKIQAFARQKLAEKKLQKLIVQQSCYNLL